MRYVASFNGRKADPPRSWMELVDADNETDARRILESRYSDIDQLELTAADDVTLAAKDRRRWARWFAHRN